MKKLILLGGFAILFIACQSKPQRYFENSTEIETLKSGIKLYEQQDWASWKANFADTAKIHHNSVKGLSTDETIQNFQDMLINFSSYGFEDEGSFTEMVVDIDNETWVNYWGIWKGILSETNEELVVPVHLTAQFIDGKIVEEHAYYDTAPIINALEAIEAAKMAEEMTAMDEEE
ncbi:nuclear transport factor 2 family protein [Flavobacteriaceae bacterium XHP0103]|uniref:nuclear transport factor 2 family protein n=1 Tax=Marixanthotalea marina TaxID=2844359 RepID=UPI002989D651|nr:nuclear transport factor 2 family protein [Marixanthotalea marina]MBU3823097.1 nuclear transport factor 2 family protein [Marixanthotalea marina]